MARRWWPASRPEAAEPRSAGLWAAAGSGSTRSSVVWVTHHSLFTRIASVDAGLLWCNLALLLAASVLPFQTAELPFSAVFHVSSRRDSRNPRRPA